MKFAATITATGVLGFLLLEVLKILLAPAAAWLLALAMIAAKVALLGLVVGVVVVAGAFMVKRANRARAESA
ncbi:MAG: hypothetical protein ACR2QM_02055 [Longimicrobiales bacterium]